MKSIIIKEVTYDVNIPTDKNAANHKILKATIVLMSLVVIMVVVLWYY